MSLLNTDSSKQQFRRGKKKHQESPARPCPSDASASQVSESRQGSSWDFRPCCAKCQVRAPEKPQFGLTWSNPHFFVVDQEEFGASRLKFSWKNRGIPEF